MVVFHLLHSLRAFLKKLAHSQTRPRNLRHVRSPSGVGPASPQTPLWGEASLLSLRANLQEPPRCAGPVGSLLNRPARGEPPFYQCHRSIPRTYPLAPPNCVGLAALRANRPAGEDNPCFQLSLKAVEAPTSWAALAGGGLLRACTALSGRRVSGRTGGSANSSSAQTQCG